MRRAGSVRKPEKAALVELPLGLQATAPDRMRSLSAMAPLALALVQRPGHKATDGEMLSLVKMLRSKVASASDDLVSMLESDAGGSTLPASEVAAMVSKCVATEWLSGAPEVDMSPYQPVWGYLADVDISSVGVPSELISGVAAQQRVRLALMRAVSSFVSMARKTYLMRHDPVRLYPVVAGAIARVCAKNLDAIVEGDSSMEDRLHSYYMLIEECGPIFCANWDSVARRTVLRLSGLTPERQLEVLSKYPDGFPLKPILEGFERDVSGMVSAISALGSEQESEDEGVIA